RIAKGKGVCGAAWINNTILVVPDVEQFPGHIACSALSKSEIVVPVRTKSGEIIGVLDIDSAILNDFTINDGMFLEEWVKIWVEASDV
ncbi:MAG: GAF domain-containing protein, partial [Flavobacteriales bacterium]